MGFFDLVVQQVGQYRTYILFNIDSDQPDTNMSLIEIFFHILPNTLMVQGLELTQKPGRPILDWSVSGEQRFPKFQSQYEREQLVWILENLLKCEESFSRNLYQKHRLFDVLGTVLTQYRQSALFNLDKERKPIITEFLVRTMNAMLPDVMRAKLPAMPEKYHQFEIVYQKKLRDWNQTALDMVEVQISKYIKVMAAASQH